MRKLKIETYSMSNHELEDSMVVPLSLIRALIKVLPNNIATKFDQNGEQLEELIRVVSDAEGNGVVYEVEDLADNERVVFSII